MPEFFIIVVLGMMLDLQVPVTALAYGLPPCVYLVCLIGGPTIFINQVSGDMSPMYVDRGGLAG